MLEFGKPYNVTFDLNIAGTSQRPSSVRAVFSAGDMFLGYACRFVTEKQYELNATVPLGVFNAGDVQFAIEAVFGNQTFTVYRKTIEAQGVAITPSTQVVVPPTEATPQVVSLPPTETKVEIEQKPDETEIEVKSGDTKVEVEIEKDDEEEKKQSEQITYNSGHVSQPKKTVDLTIEAYVPPKNLMKSFVDETADVPVKPTKSAKKVTESVQPKRKKSPADNFSIKRTKLVLV